MIVERRVVSVNVGEVRALQIQGRTITTGIWKRPVEGRVALRGVNFAGDDQADRSVHGGPDKAVYAYSREDYAYWRAESGIETPDGLFGENLTTEGIDLSAVVVGEQWNVGSTVLEVAQPRLPCFKLAIRMGDAQFSKKFMTAQRMGAYLRVVQEGDIGAGDIVRVSRAPDHGITPRDMVQALDDPVKAASLRLIARLPEFWQQVANSA